ncbi:MAG: SRPBCC family protein [Burkholderiaceae bacterium]
MTDIVHRIGIKAPAADVYAALSTIPGLAGWWTEQTAGSSRVGELIAFRFHLEDGSLLGGFDMEVTELSPEDKVRWRVKDGPPEWIGTDIEFSLSRQDDWTVVMFGHRGWREEVEFTAHCSTKWATFLVSLRDFVETGKGRPAPDDLRIGNWH